MCLLLSYKLRTFIIMRYNFTKYLQRCETVTVVCITVCSHSSFSNRIHCWVLFTMKGCVVRKLDFGTGDFFLNLI